MNSLSALVCDTRDQPAIARINEAEQVSAVLRRLSVAEELITRPDVCDVAINRDQRI
jgi:hypothetical protein